MKHFSDIIKVHWNLIISFATFWTFETGVKIKITMIGKEKERDIVK